MSKNKPLLLTAISVASLCVAFLSMEAGNILQQSPLRLEIHLGQQSYVVGSTIEVDLLVRNISSKPIYVQRICFGASADNHTYCDVRFEVIELDTKPVRLAARGALFSDFGSKAFRSEFVELCPGCFIGRTLVIDPTKYLFDQDTGKLPPGTYEMHSSYSRNAATIEESWPIKPWVGEIKSTPVQFRIVAEQ